MKAVLICAGLLMLAAPVTADGGAPDDPTLPQQCLDDPESVDCLGQGAKCIVREQIDFLYQCWGILGP